MGCKWNKCQSSNIWGVLWMNQVQMLQCCRKVTIERKVAGAIRLYGSETMILRERYRSRIRTVQMENLIGSQDIRRMDRVMNIQIRELCDVGKG